MPANTTTPIRIGIVGVGKIVRDQHLPASPKNADYRLVATASRNASVDGVASFQTIEEMLAARPRPRRRVALHAAAIPLSRRAHGAAGRQACLPGEAAGRDGQRGRGPQGAGSRKRRLAVRELAFALCAGRRGGANLPRLEPANRRCDQLEGRRPPLAPEPGMDLAGGRARRVRPRHQRAVDRHAHPAEGAVRHRRRRSNFRKTATPRSPPRSLQRCRRAGGEGRLRLAPDRPAELGHRCRDRAGQMVLSAGGAKLAVAGAHACTKSPRPNTRCSTSASPRSCGPVSRTSTSRRYGMSPMPSCSAATHSWSRSSTEGCRWLSLSQRWRWRSRHSPWRRRSGSPCRRAGCRRR